MSCDQCYDFAADYKCSALPAVKALERDVLGCNYGGTSWTTRQQVDSVFSHLELKSGSRLLEVGSGSGWPALFLSQQTGCRATLLDMPLIALEHAAQRAAADGLDGQATFVSGNGTALPFADGSFDRLSQSDVLCCLPEKLEMLRECRRVASPAARFCFTVIELAEGLSESDYLLARDTGPPFTDVPGGYPALLEQSGWTLVDRIDITAEFGDTIEKLVAGLKTNTPELQEAYGADELRDSWQLNEEQLQLVRDYKLLRFAYVAVPS